MEPSPSSVLLLLPVAAISLLGKTLDIFLLLLFSANKNWDILQQILITNININVVIDLVKALACIFTLLQIYRYIKSLQKPDVRLDDFSAKPMLFPSRTAHTRLFPTKHSFSYSYLMVGIPVGWKGSTGGMISNDISESHTSWYLRWLSLNPGGSWFTVNGDDYLARGHVEGGLQEKLHTYLQSRGENPQEYPFAYLLTAPRFLKYSSNPVSIWNLYSASKILSAVILEVNNTFNERHIYFLKNTPPSSSLSPITSPTSPRFTQTWPKDFYVSVFNSRSGSYSISTTSPLSPTFSDPSKINSTITLSSSKNHPKLIARIFSTSPALDPSTMSLLDKTIFLTKWWWVGLATFPRTIVQAITILRNKGLHWVFRPEPRKNTMPRHADALEQFIEPIFRRYLRNTVEKSHKPLVLKYTPAGILSTTEEIMLSPSAQLSNPEDTQEIKLRILTPIFYSRFVQYSYSLDALLSECVESSTISISNQGLLSTLDFNGLPPKCSTQGLFSKLHFSLLQSLRKRPALIENTETQKLKAKGDSSRPLPETKSSGPLPQSEFDASVLSYSSLEEQQTYASKVTKLFIAEYIAFGWMEILDLEIFIVRCVAAWALAGRA